MAAADGAKKEKKVRPAAPAPPPALATAALLVRGAAAKVLGLRPGPCGGEMQPVWVNEPGNAKLTLSFEHCSRPNMQKEETYDAVIDAIEVATSKIVLADQPISVFEMDRNEAEKQYGDVMYDAKSAKPDKLLLAYIPDVALVEIPANWSLCVSTGVCGAVTFQKGADKDSKKKPETLILYKKKQLSVRFDVAHGDAFGFGGSNDGERPSSEAVKEINSSEVRVSILGVDDAGAGEAAARGAVESAASVAIRSAAGPPLHPYQEEGTEDPATVYWYWFREALARRLRDAAAAGGGSKEDLLRDPTAAGLSKTCAEVFRQPLSEQEVMHLEHAPVNAEWVASLLKHVEFAAATRTLADGAEEEEGVVDPWSVSGKIDYAKLIDRFGSTAISQELLDRVERLTVGKGRVKALHPWLRRGFFYSHRDLDKICNCVEQGIPFYLYTGRGPSSASMHLGHLIPFMMTKWLQQAFDVPLVIQMTDDEKFLWKGEYDAEAGTDNLMHFRNLTTENAKDIISCGFDKKKTFIFSDLEYVGEMYPNIVRIWKAITYSQAKGLMGFVGENNIGQAAFVAIQAAPSFPSSFDVPLKGQHNLCCLIPCAIDQDPYFRITRDIAHKISPTNHPLKGKPALLHSKFFPPLQGAKGKMSASDSNSAIFLTDTAEVIEEKIMKHAFSGGRQTAKEQKELGADLEEDVSYQWLRFFLEDDVELEQIGKDYGSGSGEYWNTGSVKKRLVTLLQGMVAAHIETRAKITDKEVEEWMSVRELEF